MNHTLKKILAGAGILAASGLGGAAIAGAQGNAPAGKPSGETDRPVTGADAQRAGQAALKHVGGGKIVEVERDTPDQGVDRPEPGDRPDSAAEQAMDQKPAYTAEVQRTDGSTVEVAVDSAFNALGVEQDEADGAQDEQDGAESGADAADAADAPAQR